MTPPGISRQHSLIESLSRTIGTVLHPLLEGVGSVALLDFPSHNNVGDSAIWLGEVRYLRRVGIRIRYACDLTAFRNQNLAARIGGRTILIHGGGNLGDLWPAHQRFREAVVAAFPGHRIIQLPQSIHFRDRRSLDSARSVFDAHPDLTLLVRDQVSLDIARNEFRARSLLCPDMAFAIGPLGVVGSPTCDVVWLKRTDIESVAKLEGPEPAGVEICDWLNYRPTALMRFKNWFDQQIARHQRALGSRGYGRPLVYARVAADRVGVGLRLLSRGRVVVTDRLHGHILSVLLGIPHVLMDNSYDKIRRFHETWTRGCPLVHWAASPGEALEIARTISGARR